MNEGPGATESPESLRSDVWMMHAGVGTEGVQGTLTLETDAVAFRPNDPGSGPERFPLSRIRRARATVAGPILELRMERDIAPRIVGFYFVPPPSWEPPERDPSKGLWGSASRTTTSRKARKQAAARLLTTGVDKRDEVKRWVRSIRKAKKEG